VQARRTRSGQKSTRFEGLLNRAGVMYRFRARGIAAEDANCTGEPDDDGKLKVTSDGLLIENGSSSRLRIRIPTGGQ
jgi:hypothetical protein